MKKFLATICAAALLLTGCGSDTANVDKLGNNFSGETVKLGMITPLNSTEENYGGLLGKIETAANSDSRHLPKFYDNLRTMQMGIEAGEVKEISLYKSVADYIVANNSKFEVVPNNALAKIEYSFCFAVRKDDTALKAELDKIIDEMKADGSLDKLINEYITDADKGQAPPAIEIPTIDGADKIKVGVTGDLPPLDYVSADGQPAGFNTAMLAEIAKRLGRNVEVVDIDSGVRATALHSKFIDVVFWTVVPLGNQMPADIDKPEGLELSKPYFKDSVAHIRLKADK